MAESKKITSKEIIQENLFANTTKSAKELSDTLAALEIGFEDIIKIQAKVLKNTKLDSADSIRKVSKAIQDESKAIEALNTVKAAQVEVDAQKAAAAQLEKEDYRQLVKLKKAQLVLEQSYRGEVEKLNAKLVILRTERNNLNKADKDYQKTLDKLNKAIEKNTKEIIDSSDKYKKSKMNVGNYSESIKDALGNTGLFNGTLGQINNSLKGIIANFKAAEGTGAKLSTTLKGIAAIGIVGIITALAAIMQSSQGIIDEFAVGWAKLKDAFLGTNFEGAVKATQALRKDIRGLNLELQKLVLDAEDFKEISDDTTRSYAEREENLKKFQETRLKASEKALEIAQKELDVAEKNLIAGAAAGIVTNDLADARAAALLKVKAAEDDVADSTRISAMENRKLNIARITQEVELVRSKKKSSTAQIEILKQQIADENIQIEEREKKFEEFNRINKETFETQIKTIEEGTGKQIDQIDLLRETDNLAFANKIKNLGLGEELTALIATVVKKAQDAEIQGNEQLKKLEEDKIKRKNTILSIERDIEKIKREDAVNDLEFSQKQIELDKAKLIQKSEQSLFDRKNLDTLKETLANEETLLADIYEKKADNLKAQKKADEEAAIAETQDKEVLKAKLLKIEEQFNIDMGNLEMEAANNSKNIREENSDILNDIEKKRTQALLSGFEDVTNGLQSELDKRASLQQDAYDKEIEMRKDAIDRQAQLAADGLDNQLAFEKAQQAKTELARKDAIAKAQKQKEQAQLVEAYFNAYNARLSQDGANSGQAATQALGDVLLAKGIAKGLVQFAAEGNNMIEGPGTETSDSIPFMLSKKEAVIKASENVKHNDAVKALNAGKFSEMYIPKASFEEKARDIERSTLAMANEMLYREYTKQTKLLEKIAKKPTQQIDVDKLGNIVETIHQDGFKKIITHKRSMPRI